MTTRADRDQPGLARDDKTPKSFRGFIQAGRHAAPGLTSGLALDSTGSLRNLARQVESMFQRFAYDVDGELRRIGRFIDSEGFYRDGLTIDLKGSITTAAAPATFPPDPRLVVWAYDDFTSKSGIVGAEYRGHSGFTPQGSGSGMVIRSFAGDQNHVGVLESTTGTATTGWSGIATYDATFVLGGGEATFQSCVQVETASDGTNRFEFTSGFSDVMPPGTDTNAVYFLYSDNVNSGKWQCKTIDNSTATTADSGITATAGQWYHLKVVVNADATAANFFIDNVAVASITANIPKTGTRSVAARVGRIKKSLGTTSRRAFLDYGWLWVDLATAR